MSRTLQPDDRISHYRVVGPLGVGGMGEVYIAQDEWLGRNVALKILPPRLVRNEERLRRFVTEARSASSLNHSNIVTIHEIGHDEVRAGGSGAADASAGASSLPHYISMELISGETLGQKIHQDETDLRSATNGPQTGRRLPCVASGGSRRACGRSSADPQVAFFDAG